MSATEEERHAHQLKRKGMFDDEKMEIDRDHDYSDREAATSSNIDPSKENNLGEIQRRC